MAGAEGVDPRDARSGSRLARIHRGPGRGVDDRVGRASRDGVQHGVPVADVEAGVVGGDHVPAARTPRPGRCPSWPPAPVMRTFTECRPTPRPRRPGRGPAAAPTRRGCSAYQRHRGRRSPSSKSTAGFQPSSVRIFVESSEVAAVVAGAVGHDRLQRCRASPSAASTPSAISSMLRFDAGADVVGLADHAVVEHAARSPGSGRRRGSTRGGSAVDAYSGQRLVVEGEGREERDDLLGELVGPVVVGSSS